MERNGSGRDATVPEIGCMQLIYGWMGRERERGEKKKPGAAAATGKD